MRNNLKGIDVFVAAVEVSSFAQAAEKLHITRSAVGKSIARLEERLGVVLFQRTTRTQSLTDEG
ncbi:LysR family transcriptional regulator, partial [Escherichia coli]|uniref:LysR family transcriptional regulator n=1 Tax=Escherichia coli TaxID=562 RepID=UPI0015F653E0